jgi:hypothetical protein
VRTVSRYNRASTTAVAKVIALGQKLFRSRFNSSYDLKKFLGIFELLWLMPSCKDAQNLALQLITRSNASDLLMVVNLVMGYTKGLRGFGGIVIGAMVELDIFFSWH